MGCIVDRVSQAQTWRVDTASNPQQVRSVFSVSSAEELGVYLKTEESLKDFQQDVDLINKISKNLGGWQEPESMCCWLRQFRDVSKKLSQGYLGEGRNTIAERWFQVAGAF